MAAPLPTAIWSCPWWMHRAPNWKAWTFRPFAALADIPMAMTAHVVYSALDPDNCCTLSATVIGEVDSRPDRL
jgi:hypothetical protein